MSCPTGVSSLFAEGHVQLPCNFPVAKQYMYTLSAAGASASFYFGPYHVLGTYVCVYRRYCPDFQNETVELTCSTLGVFPEKHCEVEARDPRTTGPLEEISGGSFKGVRHEIGKAQIDNFPNAKKTLQEAAENTTPKHADVVEELNKAATVVGGVWG